MQYVFDSNILIDIYQNYYPEVFESVWEKIEELIESEFPHKGTTPPLILSTVPDRPLSYIGVRATRNELLSHRRSDKYSLPDTSTLSRRCPDRRAHAVPPARCAATRLPLRAVPSAVLPRRPVFWVRFRHP